MIRFYFRWSPQTINKIRTVLLLAMIIMLTVFLFQSLLAPREIGDNRRGFGKMIGAKVNLNSMRRVLYILGMDTQAYKDVLAGCLPPLETFQGKGQKGYLAAMSQALLDVEPGNPRSFFGQGMTALGAMEVLAAVSVESHPLFEDEAIVEIPEFIPEEPGEPIQNHLVPDQGVSEGAKVIIFNTHNAETYSATDGVSKKEGENAGIVKIAARLEHFLQTKYQIATERSETIHDFPTFVESYSNSANTLKKLLERNPHARVTIDVHRDAGHAKPLTVTIGGKKCAQIRLIVGSDGRLPHPNWMTNREFARQITGKMDEMYPGLSLGYRVQSGRYNQHLHSHAILMEVGNDLNSLEEAYQSMELFAAVLNELL